MEKNFLAYDLLQKGVVKQIVIVTPSNRLRTQWTEKASQVSIDLSSDFTKEIQHIVVPSDFLGLVTTYQEVSASKGEPFRWYGHNKATFVIFDEIHHCGEELSWGDSIRNGFELAYSRLLLSGTPFRSDDKRIPFVRYKQDGVLQKSHADYNYGYGDALQENGERVKRLYSRLREHKSDLVSVPSLIRQIVQNNMWQNFTVEKTGQVVEHENFLDFITQEPPEGLGATYKNLWILCQDDIEVREIISSLIPNESVSLLIEKVNEVKPSLDKLSKNRDLLRLKREVAKKGHSSDIFATNTRGGKR